MFDMPSNKVQQILKEKHDNQLSEMWKNTPRITGLNEKGEYVNDVINKSKTLGIPMTVITYKPLGFDKPKEYLVASTDVDTLNKMLSNVNKEFPEWLERQKFNARGEILLDKVIFDITDINKDNFFAKNSYIMRYVQNMAIAKTAFENEKLPVPDHISGYAVTSIWELDHMRANKDVSPDLQKRYNEIYKKAVATYAQEFANKFKLELLPHNNKHQVKESYFKENHISITWDVVNDKFYDFMQKELKAGKYPDFVFYKADNAYIKIKNLAKEFEKITKGNSNSPNFWANDKGTEKFYICYPTACEKDFSTMLNDFNTRMLPSRTTIPELIGSVRNDMYKDHPLDQIYIHIDDLDNWDSLCRANNVANGGIKWAINDGSYGDIKFDSQSSLEMIPILYKTEDMDYINAFVNRLSREMRDYVPMSDKSIEEHKPISRTQKQVLSYRPTEPKRNTGIDI